MLNEWLIGCKKIHVLIRISPYFYSECLFLKAIFYDREIDVIGIFRYKNTWPICLDLLSSGKIDVKPLITHRFGFSQEEIEKAFKISADGSSSIKVMFNL